jgi:folate-binding protein YgfZ
MTSTGSSRVENAAPIAGHPHSATDNFGDTRAEFQALVSRTGLYDLSNRAKIAVAGGDRVRWLNGMVSNNIRDLAPGHGVYAFLLNAQGRIQADLYAFQRGESLLIDTEESQREKILALFDRYIIADDVEIADISGKIASIGLTGPESRGVFNRAGIALPELAHMQFADVEWSGIPITILHSDEEAGDSWRIWISPAERDRMWESLVKAGAQPTGQAALDLFRISRGIPQFGVDIRDRDLPQETGQARALNFTKGCYLGQEIVERIRSRGAVHRQFAAFEVEGVLPQTTTGTGIKILAGEKEVGEITSSAVLPFADRDRSVALGYLRREAREKELLAGAAKLNLATIPIGFDR